MTSNNAKFIQGLILLTSPFLLLGCVIGVLNSRQNLKIYFDEFKPGFFLVEDINCVALETSSSAPSYCHAKGVILDLEGNFTDIKNNLDLGYDFEINWDQKKYPVFYRENGRFPIPNTENAMELNKQPYLINALIGLGLPFGLSGLLLFYFMWLKTRY